jgi:ketosteroid isomerase-like protein
LKMAEGKIGFSPTRTTARASSDPRDVIAVVERFFASLRTRDTVSIRAMSAPDLVVVSSRVDTSGKATVRRQPIADMLRSIATSAEELRERMWDPEVKIDGDVAMLWAPYDFHVGSRFSHCGTDSFQFVRQNGVWVMTGLSYTVRQTGCTSPR